MDGDGKGKVETITYESDTVMDTHDQLLALCRHLGISVPPPPVVHQPAADTDCSCHKSDDLLVQVDGVGVFTAIYGDNAKLMQQVAALYFQPGYRIADVTFGKGVFWRNIDTGQYDFHPSDLKTCPTAAFNFCNLPYEGSSFDVVVLDPPYVHDPGRLYFEGRYRNGETTKGLRHADLLGLYAEGMEEGKRILKPGGLLLVKCKDEIESGRQRWSHIEIYEIGRRLGLMDQDLFVLTPPQAPPVQCVDQQHARKNHSYLWIFKKPS